MRSALFGAALVMSAMAANAQVVDYQFTGTITSSNIGSVADGATITGTLIFNLANSDLSSDGLSFGAISNTGNWMRGTEGAMPVFSETASSGAFSFSDALPTSFLNSSQITGGNGALPPDGYFYSASNTQFTSARSFTDSDLFLLGPSAPFTLGGLPMFTGSTLGTGDIGYSSGQQISYTITSLKPTVAPEIDADSALGALSLVIGGMLVLRGRRQLPSGRLG